MGAVAAEDHRAVDEALQPPALKGVDAHPLQPKVRMAQHALDPGPDDLGAPLALGIGVPAELEVDAVDRVGLPMQQRRLPLVEGRLEPEAPLGREVGCHLDVGDEEALLEHLPREVETQHLAHRRARPVAGHDVSRLEVVGAVRRLDPQRGVVPARLQSGHPVAEPQIDQRMREGRLGEVTLHVILLEVDEGRHPVAVLGQQVEREDLALAVIGPPDLPADALLEHPIGDAQPVQDLERALRPADRARARGHHVVVVEHRRGDPVPRHVER